MSSGSSAHVGKAALVTPEVDRRRAYFSNFMQRLRPALSLDSRYLAYLFRAQSARDQLQRDSSGSMAIRNLNGRMLGDLVVPIADWQRQQGVADFLDREVGRLDEVAAAKRRMIELLDEKRTALITHTVTKGLNPDAPMKETNIPWLGQIPAHWDVMQLRRFGIEIKTGPFGSQLHSHDYVSDGVPIINATHIVGGRVVPDSAVTADDATTRRLADHRLQQGDIVFGRRGEAARAALVGEREEGWLCGTGSIRLRIADARVDLQFVEHFVGSVAAAQYFETVGVRLTMLNLNEGILRDLVVPCPPIAEQQAIAETLNSQLSTLNAAADSLKRQIELLSEFKSALITAAVAGQLDAATLKGERSLDDAMEELRENDAA